MCVLFGADRCVLCVAQRFGYVVLAIACGKCDHVGKRWAGNGFITNVASVLCGRACRRWSNTKRSSLRGSGDSAAERCFDRSPGYVNGRGTGQNLAIWAVDPPKSRLWAADASPTVRRPDQVRHRHARHAVTCENFPDSHLPAARKSGGTGAGRSAVVPLSAQNP